MNKLHSSENESSPSTLFPIKKRVETLRILDSSLLITYTLKAHAFIMYTHQQHYSSERERERETTLADNRRYVSTSLYL